MNRLSVRDRVLTSHDACTSRTSRILRVALLQQLKIEAFIPAPIVCEVQCMRKFLNAQSIALIKIHRQLCQVYGYTWLDGQHISCRSSTERCLVITHSIAQTSLPSDFHLFLHLRNSSPVTVSVFRMTVADMSVTVWFQCKATDFYDTVMQKLVPRHDECLNCRGEYVEKIAQHLLYLFQ